VLKASQQFFYTVELPRQQSALKAAATQFIIFFTFLVFSPALFPEMTFRLFPHLITTPPRHRP
jgi:hypothetical protein